MGHVYSKIQITQHRLSFQKNNNFLDIAPVYTEIKQFELNENKIKFNTVDIAYVYSRIRYADIDQA